MPSKFTPHSIYSNGTNKTQYWRRRLFKLTGSKLTAYHESTGQPRATINLANASKLIDDRRALTQRETTGKGGSRRKSGFAEEEEGYMFVEEGFRIRFANGEVIDFYADSTEKKGLWMEALDGVIGSNAGSERPAWCDAVLRREESVRRKEARVLAQMGEKKGEKGDMGPPMRPGMHTNARDRYAHSRTKSAMA